jgi:hypothetical protein
MTTEAQHEYDTTPELRELLHRAMTSPSVRRERRTPRSQHPEGSPVKDQFPLNETDQAQLDALRERMEAERYATLAATKNDEDRA